jgi:hypothetical protein
MTKKIMKKLPIGLQSIEQIIEGNFVYVDKTALIHKLIDEGKHYFLSRPRRFGKSLLIDTLKNIFLGNKKLFKKLAIGSMQHAWKEHPILHLDFSQIPHTTKEVFATALKRRFRAIAAEYGVSITIPTLEEGLIDLIDKLAAKKKSNVVVLIDEYDKPIIDHLDQLDIAKENRTLLKNCLGVLKGLDAKLRFVFITGVSKFAQVSLFSGMNNLNDITTNSQYAALLGYTEKEVGIFFKDHLAAISKAKGKSIQLIIKSMRDWYNGYGFSREKISVYNPFSSLLFLQNGEISDYWFKTATPTFLIDQIKKSPYPISQISGVEAGSEIFDSHDLDRMNLTSLMWQTGYLTIKNYNPETLLYYLDYPNEEVKLSFLKRLAEGVTGMATTEITGYARACAEALYFGNLKLFFAKLQNLFANIPYDMNVSEEKYYQTIFYVIAKLIGLDAHLEVKTNLGRIDMVIKTKESVYIFEFKIDSTAKKALQQIKDNLYAQPFAKQGKKLVLIGANFSTKERNISDWKISTKK